mgnify:CR=1 FL=1
MSRMLSSFSDCLNLYTSFFQSIVFLNPFGDHKRFDCHQRLCVIALQFPLVSYLAGIKEKYNYVCKENGMKCLEVSLLSDPGLISSLSTWLIITERNCDIFTFLLSWPLLYIALWSDSGCIMVYASWQEKPFSRIQGFTSGIGICLCFAYGVI